MSDEWGVNNFATNCLLSHQLMYITGMDEKFQVSSRRDTEDWMYLNAKGDQGAEFDVVVDCLGGVVTCTHNSVPVDISQLPPALRVVLELCQASA